MKMECGICDRFFDKARKPVCVSCAQVTLYEPRIHQATSLLSRENAHTHSEAIVRPGNDGVLAALPQDADWDAITSAAKKHNSERAQAEQERVLARITAITEQADTLKTQMESYKSYVEETRAKNQKRRQEVTKEQQELAKRKPQALNPVQHAKQKAAQRVERIYTKTIDARAYICRHSSNLNGIHQLRDAQGKHTGRYKLNGLTLPNLKELNSAIDPAEPSNSPKSDAYVVEHHTQINACLDNICHLLGVWCHYLSIRLPAEVILPHGDFPHAAILPERSSYKVSDLPYPVTLASHPSSPSASRLLQEQRNLPRPRLLHLDRPLSRLAKEDPKTFGLFVEGAMLLAWDVAWLCRSQGVATINSFDEVCDIGRNIWLLSLSQQGPRNDRSTPDRRSRGESEGVAATRKPVTFGMFSHGNLRNSLAGHDGAMLMQEWRISQPHRLIDKLRNHLLVEITGAEWDVLDEKDFDGMTGDGSASAVLVGGSGRKTLEPAMSMMSVQADEGSRAKGESGWMKVRDRGSGKG